MFPKISSGGLSGFYGSRGFLEIQEFIVLSTQKKLAYTEKLVGELIRADFWEGDATKRFSVKKGFFSEKGEAIQ